jgi:hypothetical protein
VGTIQSCKKCGAYLDVGEVDWADEVESVPFQEPPRDRTARRRTIATVALGLGLLELLALWALLFGGLDQNLLGLNLASWLRWLIVLGFAAATVLLVLALPRVRRWL